MFLLAQRLLEQRDAAVEQFQRPEVLERHVRLAEESCDFGRIFQTA